MKSTTANAPGFGPAIELFRRATRDVPAYMDFLAKRGVVTAEIHTSEDFAAVPVMTKAGYLQVKSICVVYCGLRVILGWFGSGAQRQVGAGDLLVLGVGGGSDGL